MSNPRDPDADIILRSSDGVQFRVRKSLLSQASPVFSDMFSVPQPNSSLDSDAPVDLSESSKTIKLTLVLADSPPTSLLIDSLSDIANLLQAADKYDIKTIRDHSIYSLNQPKFLEKEPLRVYAIASRYGAHDAAALAARHTLRYSLVHAEYFPELEMVDGGTIYRILGYRNQCTAAALEVATKHTWIRNLYVFFNCPQVKVESGEFGEDNSGSAITAISQKAAYPRREEDFPYSVTVHRWWTKFMAATKVALSDSINPETIRDKSRVMEALSSASQCSHCRKRINLDFTNFLEAFVNEVEARVSEVKFVRPAA